METGPRVFLSHASDDIPEVNELYRRLSAAGFQPWTVQMNVGPGEPWRVKVEQAINECDFFLAILSRATAHVGAFAQEWTLAKKRLKSISPHTIFLIPARLEDTPMPEDLREFQCVDLFEPAGWEQLVRSMGGPVLPVVTAPVPPPELIEACRKGNCVVYVGAGLSKPAGYPVWSRTIERLLDWTIEQKFVDAQLGGSYRHTLQSGQVDLAADGIVSAVRANDKTGKALQAFLAHTFQSPLLKPTAAQRLLPSVGFSAAVTTNFDSLLEQTFRGSSQAARNDPSRSRATLRKTLVEHFSEEEVRDMCFDLGIDYENLPGAGKNSKVRELISYFERQKRTGDLVAWARQMRPVVQWDTVSYVAESFPVYTSLDSKELTAALARNEFFILKLSGIVEKPESLQVTPAEYRDTIEANRVYSQFIEKLFSSRTVFFLGASLDGILSHLDVFPIRSRRPRHYALVSVSGTEWQAKADRLQRRYNVQVLPYQAGETHEDMLEFLDSLAKTLTKAISRGPNTPIRPSPTPAPLLLKRLQFENIGPFDTLELELDAHWNVLLGDNGVGKSSILKAIALALCGKDAQPYADRLIRFGQTTGRIILEPTRGETNEVELSRTGITITGMEADIRVLSGRELLGTEPWLAVGFPPLRQMSWTSRIGLQSTSGRPQASSDDLLPLVLSDPDPRMDDLRDTIYRLEAQASIDKDDRPRRVRDAIFQVVSSLTEGLQFRFSRLDASAGRIWVMTDDGEVPIEAVSQGTQSLLGWVGVLVKRLFEVYEGEDQPLHKPAVVLIDEIDAHMHPAWQRTIARKLLRLFPNVQFIATTHSPLVVAEAERQQVFRLIRDPQTKRIKVCSPNEDVQGMGAGALLTSDLFGLPSQLDQTTQEKLDRRRYLAGKPFKELSTKEREELQGLSSELESMGFNYEFRDPLYSQFLKAWAHETKGEQEWGATPLTREQAERQAELIREIVAMLKSRSQD